MAFVFVAVGVSMTKKTYSKPTLVKQQQLTSIVAVITSKAT